jgi:L-ascorbate metabolism protein UlaG (beta-lactamase superfamily)
MQVAMDVEVTWYGQTCFRLSGQNSISIVTDPYPPDVGVSLPRLQADVVTVSHHNASCGYLAAAQGPFKLVDGPGEYEISGVFITGISTFADSKRGHARGLNTVFAFDFDGTTICHLGRLGQVPTQSQVKNLGSVNVLLVPVGGGGSLTSTQASEVIGLFEPDVVVPMRYRLPGLDEDLESVDHFLKEMGMEAVDGQKTLKVGESGTLEETRVVVLDPIINRR